MTLAELNLNQSAQIAKIPSEPHLFSKLLEHGILPQTKIVLAHKAPFNGPIAIGLHGTKITVPKRLAQQILVQPL